jgi:hypothetical protein
MLLESIGTKGAEIAIDMIFGMAASISCCCSMVGGSLDDELQIQLLEHGDGNQRNSLFFG